MTRCWLFTHIETGIQTLTPVALPQPKVMQTVWIAGKRYIVTAVDADAGMVWLKNPPKLRRLDKTG